MEGLAITVDEMLGSTGLAMKVDPGVPIVYAGFAGKALTHQSHACQLLLAHSRPSPHGNSTCAWFAANGELMMQTGYVSWCISESPSYGYLREQVNADLYQII